MNGEISANGKRFWFLAMMTNPGGNKARSLTDLVG